VLASVLGAARADPDRLVVVDVPLVICPGAAGKVEFEVTVPGPADQPHVLSFFRNGKASASVTYALKDAIGQEIVASTTTTLMGYARRLADVIDVPLAENNCQDFWLSDGRDPVELPDTWSEARSSFRSMCEAEGSLGDGCAAAEEDVFRGYPRSGGALRTDDRLCARLRARAASALDPETAAFVRARGAGVLPALGPAPPRRAKGASSGSSTSSGGTAVGNYGSSRVDGVYSSSTATLGRSYPGGYSSASYGYSGVGARSPSRMAGTYAVVFWYSPRGYYGSRSYTSCQQASSQCSGGQVKCNSGETCDWVQPNGEQLIRDDLMDTGFLPSEWEQPFTLTITDMSGSAFSPSGSCPPSGWDPATNTPFWTPTPGQDLYAALSDVEYIEDALPWWGTLIIVLSSVIFCCFCFCLLRRKKNKQSEDEPENVSDGEVKEEVVGNPSAEWADSSVPDGQEVVGNPSAVWAVSSFSSDSQVPTRGLQNLAAPSGIHGGLENLAVQGNGGVVVGTVVGQSDTSFPGLRVEQRAV